MKFPGLVCAAVVMLPAAAFAASAFDGTWKASLNHIQLPTTPDVYVIEGGRYTCSTCTPPYTVKADGTDQKVSGHDWDSIAVTLTPNSVAWTTKLKGKPLSSNKTVLGADGKTSESEYIGYNGAQPVTSKWLNKLVTPGSAGSHPLSGSWLATKIESFSDSAALETLAMTDDGFSFSSNGQTYEAKFDGKQYPITGDVTHTMVRLKKVSPSQVVEYDYDKGKLVGTTRMSVSADGKTLHVTATDTRTKDVTRYTLDKQ
jgi:hypothetical protein